MQKPSLIVVVTPLQFINAMAYIKQTNKNCVCLVLNTYEKSIKQISNMDTNKICIYPLDNIKIFNRYIQLMLKIFYTLAYINVRNEL